MARDTQCGGCRDVAGLIGSGTTLVVQQLADGEWQVFGEFRAPVCLLKRPLFYSQWWSVLQYNSHGPAHVAHHAGEI